ncbi:hypothetical protein FSP39_011421 [Pinctada imbricata]|uniref:Glycoside-hydrolase family GH114 TIM-barrel domain-containing protein n=1 Tax=Pinctada imbricata TaxID=66713 RepID=A0AA89BX86_PINIB|nr:hypothetical protein FSP39_011421 [Pinctada imbricata]
MRARLDLAVHYHCDGVEPDKNDAYTNDNGVGLTASDQLAYNKWIGTELSHPVTSISEDIEYNLWLDGSNGLWQNIIHHSGDWDIIVYDEFPISTVELLQ